MPFFMLPRGALRLLGLTLLLIMICGETWVSVVDLRRPENRSQILSRRVSTMPDIFSSLVQLTYAANPQLVRLDYRDDGCHAGTSIFTSDVDPIPSSKGVARANEA
jgi:hypothetical protein